MKTRHSSCCMCVSMYVRNPEDRKRSWLVGVASRSDSLQISFWVCFCVVVHNYWKRAFISVDYDSVCEELSVDFIQEVAAF